MAKREVFDCDRCKKLNITPIFISIPNEVPPWVGFPAPVIHKLDLCFECCQTVINKFLRRLNTDPDSMRLFIVDERS